VVALAALLPLLGLSSSVKAQPNQMTFFVTSEGPGDGANLGGLAGADAHCQKLAESAGAGNRTWRAYLSAVGAGSAVCVNARDRIGSGPWQNAKGVTIANSVDELHSDSNAINKGSALDEDGDEINGLGDNPNQHDMLTGSTPDGRCFPPGNDTTCGNWTRNGDGSAVVGHHDRQGTGGANSSSWNSAHPSRGCSQDNLRSTGGAGLFYCFAIN
jgi:hypothetical protein